jgi:hypothetical protein
MDNAAEAIKRTSLSIILNNPQHLPLLKSLKHGSSKIGNEHIDNSLSIMKVLKSFDGKSPFLGHCKQIVDLLQFAYQSIDDTLDDSQRSREDTYFDEVLKMVGNIGFTDILMDLLHKKSIDLDQGISIQTQYAKKFVDTASSPVRLLQNIARFLKTEEKGEEIELLSNNQTIRAIHTNIYFFTAFYLVDGKPSEKDVEKLGNILRISRGIELSNKDLYDLELDMKKGSYNIILIQKQKNHRKKIRHIIQDINHVQERLLRMAETQRAEIDNPRYFNAAMSAYSIAKEAYDFWANLPIDKKEKLIGRHAKATRSN